MTVFIRFIMNYDHKNVTKYDITYLYISINALYLPLSALSQISKKTNIK